MSEDLRSELAIMRDEFFESDEGKKCLDIKTIGNDPKYLKNRIECAFVAGALSEARQNAKNIKDTNTVSKDR